MGIADEPLAAWETDPVAAARDRHGDPALLAAQRAAWPMLHGVDDGSSVDLWEVWPLLEERGYDQWSTPVEALAGRAGGAGRRLLYGVASLFTRDDADLRVSVEDAGDDTLEIVAWSWGCAANPGRAWWLGFTLSVRCHANGTGNDLAFAVAGRDGVTVFRESAGGRLAGLACRFYLSWEGRAGIAARLGRPRTPLPAPLPLERFLERVRRRVQT
ncbi:hypothetical protein [Nonomuraea typhae]|uniref:DUF1990 family protein n=1 Tax=Nonomuraea typhae TaxID=2603600 RepID=A0ABW7Z006_9ACTN